VNDLRLARAAFAAAIKRWPGAKITLRNGARIIEKTLAGGRLSARTVLVQLGLSGTGSRTGSRPPHPRFSRASTPPTSRRADNERPAGDHADRRCALTAR
jgi:hypothetical protein